MKKIKVLSLFDGISCARVALERAGIEVEKYFASEIDKYAIAVAQKNFPDTVQLGGVHSANINRLVLGKIDLMIGGSPCQDLSIAKAERKGLEGSRSGLFWEYVRILQEIKPKYFVLENVASMPKKDKEIITQTLGVEPIMIDASLVSAQRRKRLFWTNLPNVCLPKDKGILLSDIIETDKNVVFQYRRTYWRKTEGGKVPTLTANMGTGGNNVPYILQVPRGNNKGGIRAIDGKVPTLTSSFWEQNNKLVEGEELRKLTPVECERLQCLPDGYTEGISNTQRYKCIGNAFNVDVVAHILQNLT